MESWRPEIEDGLTLFQHMRAREHHNYLNNCNDNIEEIKYEGGLSTFRISGSTPTRKGGGLLISDIEKSDYDWLLTPPGTPLFPSLDQETASINFAERTPLMGSGSASKSLKDFSLKPFTESPGPHRVSMAFSTRTSTYTNLSSQRSFAVSPARPSSGRAKSPSASPSPLTRSRPMAGALSPSRSTAPVGQLPATPRNSISRPSTPTLCRNNTSPSAVSRRGYLAQKGPRRSLSPTLAQWEPIMAVLSTEPLANLRTSPSSRSLQRGKSECSRQVVTTSKDLDTRHGALCARQLAAGRNRNKGSDITSEVDKFSTRCEDRKYISSPARRKPQPTTTCTKDMISSFANEKLIERHGPSGRNLQNMFRPLMMSAPSVLPSTYVNEVSEQNTRVSPQRDCSQGSDKEFKNLQDNWSNTIDHGKPEGREKRPEGTGDRELDLFYASQDYILSDEATKDPIKSEGKPREEMVSEDARYKNQTFLFEDSKDESAYEDIQISGAQEFTQSKLSKNLDTDAGVKDSESSIKEISKQNRKHILLSHSFSGDSQMQNVRVSRGKISDHAREDNKMLVSNQVQSPLRYKLNKDDAKPVFESYSTQAFTNGTHATSEDGARSTSFHPARRPSCIKNADIYGMWNMKKAGSFDISTTDSYSCSESLDSSYVDNHTEKFSEDLSEVDSMSHAGYWLSTSNMTNHSFYNIIGKPFTEIPTELGMGEGRFSSVSGGLEGIELPIEYCEKEQRIRSRMQSQASTGRDNPELWAPSPDFHSNAVAEGNRLDAKDVCSLLDACNRNLLEIKHSTASELHTEIDVKGEYAAKTLTLVAEDVDAGKDLASKSTSAGACMVEEITGWENGSKKMESPLRRHVTLEEATDTILFCSSIIHEIVYEAVTLGEEKCGSNLKDPSKMWGHISGPSSSWRTSIPWSLNKRESACIMTQQPVSHGLQPRVKHVLTSNNVALPSAHEADKTNRKRTKKSLCGCGFCRVM